MEQRYTRTEVTRMLGVTRQQLDYWTKLHLVQPRARWGERFYSFSDLVALETIKRLASHRVPVRRLRRAINALETQLGQSRAPLAQLRILTNGREVVVQFPNNRSIEPLTGQFVLEFKTKTLAGKVRAMFARTAEEWFELGLASDTVPETLERAVEAYGHAVELAPDWVEAHLNLGTVLYQLERMADAKSSFAAAVALDPENPLAHFNLACALDQLGEIDSAIEHLRRTIELAPSMADAHLNLALAYERRGHKAAARYHLSLYLRYEPQGPWAQFARARIGATRTPRGKGKVTPFPKKGG